MPAVSGTCLCTCQGPYALDNGKEGRKTLDLPCLACYLLHGAKHHVIEHIGVVSTLTTLTLKRHFVQGWFGSSLAWCWFDPDLDHFSGLSMLLVILVDY